MVHNFRSKRFFKFLGVIIPEFDQSNVFLLRWSNGHLFFLHKPHYDHTKNLLSSIQGETTFQIIAETYISPVFDNQTKPLHNTYCRLCLCWQRDRSRPRIINLTLLTLRIKERDERNLIKIESVDS